MTMTRLAASIAIPYAKLVDSYNTLNLVAELEDRMLRELGTEIARALAQSKQALTFHNLRFEERRSDDFDKLRLRAIVDMYETEAVQVRMFNVMPIDDQLSFPLYQEGQPLHLEWQCGYCGQVNLYRDHLDCRKCGAPRLPKR